MGDNNIDRQSTTFSILNSQFYIRLIRWAFARFYREFAWTYDVVATTVSGGRWFAWGRAALPHLRGRVLELGCGTGELQRALAARPGQPPAVALDASPQMIAITRRKLAHDGLPARLVRAIAQALPFPDASFDTIVATFPSEYIVEHATLAELQRALRPNGRLVVILAATFASDGVYQRAVDLLYRVTLQRSPRDVPEDRPRSLLGQHLAALGFAVEERWEPAASGQVYLVIGSR